MSFERKWTFSFRLTRVSICIVLNYVSIVRTLLYICYFLHYHCHDDDHHSRKKNEEINLGVILTVGVVSFFYSSYSFYWSDHNDALFDMWPKFYMYLFDQLSINETAKAKLWWLCIREKERMRIQGNTHSTYDPVHCIFVYTLTFKTNEQKPRKECIFFL